MLTKEATSDAELAARRERAVKVTLQEPLEGRFILVDPEAITMGFLEDVQSGRGKEMLDSVAEAVVEGDLPKGTDRAGLRRLRPAEYAAVVAGVTSVMSVPKND